MKLFDVLDTIQWAEDNFGSLVTNSICTRRDVLRAVNRGFAKSVGDVLLCDDDGFHLDPERYAEGFILTDSGREKLNELQAAS